MSSACCFGLSQTLLSLALVLLLLSNAQFSSSQSNPQPSCGNSFRCGNITADFPFWGEGRSVSCGHTRLRLRCDKNANMTVLELEEVEYNVLSIDFTSPSLRLARKDYFSGLFCSPVLANTTLDSSLFEYHQGYKNLTIFYGCKSGFEDPLNFTCPRGEFEVGSLKNSTEFYSTCSSNVNVIVPESFLVGEPSGALLRLGHTLREGFVAKFSMRLETDYFQCQECLNSGGLCGYTYTNRVCCTSNNSTLRIICPSTSPPPASQPSTEAVSESPLKAAEGGYKQYPVDAACDECNKSGGVCGNNATSGGFIGNCAGKPQGFTRASSDNSLWKKELGIGVSAFLSGIIILSAALTLYQLRKLKDARKITWGAQNIEELITLKRYSYAKVRKMTNVFTHTLGKGGFGTVYKGKLPDGRNVAVKILNESKGNGEEFINEVASMSRTSHVNIVSLLGFCYEGTKRAIIYEFVQNGSLDKFISEKISLKMEWKTLYNIAVGVARGLEYLHNRCNTRIVHFDIKPQNILLDEDLCPKISDFGLAKLCEKKESIMSLLDARGTLGYIAPEVLSKNYGRVSHKSDVYSYGMLVLEMVGARNNNGAQPSLSNSSSMYFPDWIYNDLERGENARLRGNLIAEEEGETAKKMVLVGLWCIQTNPSDRPPMSKVVEMMEGSVESLQVPPKPLLCFPVATVPDSADENPSSPEPSWQGIEVSFEMRG